MATQLVRSSPTCTFESTSAEKVMVRTSPLSSPTSPSSSRLFAPRSKRVIPWVVKKSVATLLPEAPVQEMSLLRLSRITRLFCSVSPLRGIVSARERSNAVTEPVLVTVIVKSMESPASGVASETVLLTVSVGSTTLTLGALSNTE